MFLKQTVIIRVLEIDFIAYLKHNKKSFIGQNVIYRELT